MPRTRPWRAWGRKETIWAAAGARRHRIEYYGVPQALYVDGKNLYSRCGIEKERPRGEEPITQFGRMCAKLGIELIAAGSRRPRGGWRGFTGRTRTGG